MVEEGQSILSKEMNGDCLEIKIVFSLEDCDAEQFGMRVRCSEDGREETVISYDVNSIGIDVFCRGGKVELLSLNVWKLESIWR